MVDLGVLPGHDTSVAESINDRGQVVGYSSNSTSGEFQGVLWQDGVLTPLPVEPAGSPGAAINNRGDVVGGGVLLTLHGGGRN
jgi:probable HAF family extracellular repeat protein